MFYGKLNLMILTCKRTNADLLILKSMMKKNLNYLTGVVLDLPLSYLQVKY